MDDYQVRTPTDIIGQHIHLPKWDLTTTDGAAKRLELRGRHAVARRGARAHPRGQRVEHAPRVRSQGSGGADRCSAVRHQGAHLPGGYGRGENQTVQVPVLTAKSHPYFGQFGRADWIGARTTLQRLVRGPRW